MGSRSAQCSQSSTACCKATCSRVPLAPRHPVPPRPNPASPACRRRSAAARNRAGASRLDAFEIGPHGDDRGQRRPLLRLHLGQSIPGRRHPPPVVGLVQRASGRSGWEVTASPSWTSCSLPSGPFTCNKAATVPGTLKDNSIRCRSRTVALKRVSKRTGSRFKVATCTAMGGGATS